MIPLYVILVRICVDFLIRLPNWMPLPHWVSNPLYGPIDVDDNLNEYSDAEDPSDTEPL